MRFRGALAIAIGILLLAGQVSGQYYGRNKVRYKEFHFIVLHTQHFDIYYYTTESKVVRDAAEMLERWHARYMQIFNFPLKNQPVILYESPADFEQTNVISDLIPQEVGGVTEPLDRRIIVALTGVNADDNHVLGHELVHAFQFALIERMQNTSFQQVSVPTWFIEGMPEYMSIGDKDPSTAVWLRDAVQCGRAPTIKQAADDSRYFPYRFGHAIWAYITGTYGDSSIAPLFMQIMNRGWNEGFKKALGVKFDTLSQRFQKTLRDTYSPQLAGRSRGSHIGKQLIAGEGGYNLSPSLSPDGRSIAFLSMRDMFSFDLFLADAATGKTIQKLATSNRDRHFEAISYINSSGTWSPDGKKFAIAVFENGRNAIGIFDVKSRNLLRTIDIRAVDAIYQLAWSPVDSAIAFFGTTYGRGHLYLYDFATQTVNQLTSGEYTDVEPAWSPDGKSIAFATDRGALTSLDSLFFGKMRLALFNLETKEISTIAMDAKTTHTNPQFSPDGRSIYFIGDPDGVPDVYRYELTTENFYRVTKVSTGVTGLTTMSPALSVAKNSGKIVCNIFEKSNYDIYALPDSAREGRLYQRADSTREGRLYQRADSTREGTLFPRSDLGVQNGGGGKTAAVVVVDTLRGRPTGEPDTSAFNKNASLPPRPGKVVDAYLKDPTTGFVDPSTFVIAPFRQALHLTYGGQLYGGLATDYYGLGIVGGAYLLFADMLGDHLLGVGAQLNGGLMDFGAQVEYLNQSKRFIWGVAGSHIPYLSSTVAFGNDTSIVNGTPTAVQTATVLDQRLFDDELSLLAQYPLSINRRLEFSLSLIRYSYNVQQQFTVAAPDGQIVSQTTSTVTPPSALDEVSAGVGYVGDYSFEGYNGPISGTRFHFEVDPTTGSLTYLTGIADYRYYYFLRPVTFALRGVHVGRYLGGADDSRLSVLFVGYPTWVRGYNSESFDLSNCGADSNSGDCGKYNRLIGSKVLVGNFEIRLPILGTQRLGLIDFRYLPTDLVAFFDGGIAWTARSAPDVQLTSTLNDRVPVFSTGLALRFNILGILVLQVYYVYPFERPQKGAFFNFVFAPAW